MTERTPSQTVSRDSAGRPHVPVLADDTAQRAVHDIAEIARLARRAECHVEDGAPEESESYLDEIQAVAEMWGRTRPDSDHPQADADSRKGDGKEAENHA